MAKAAKKKQAELKGFERPSDKEVDQQVQAYVAPMYEQRDLASKVKHEKARLVELLAKKGLNAYTYVDGEYSYEVSLNVTAAVSIKRTALDSDAEGSPLTVVDGGDAPEDGTETASF